MQQDPITARQIAELRDRQAREAGQHGIAAKVHEQVRSIIRGMREPKPGEQTRHVYLASLSMKPQGSVYAGTVSAKTIAKRRARNRAARNSRRLNRR